MAPGFGKFKVFFSVIKKELPSPSSNPSSPPPPLYMFMRKHFKKSPLQYDPYHPPPTAPKDTSLKYIPKCTLFIIVFLILNFSFNVHPSPVPDHLPCKGSSENKAGKIHSDFYTTERTIAIYNPHILASTLSINTLSIKRFNDLFYYPHTSHVFRKFEKLVRYVQQYISPTLSAIYLILKQYYKVFVLLPLIICQLLRELCFRGKKLVGFYNRKLCFSHNRYTSKNIIFSCTPRGRTRTATPFLKTDGDWVSMSRTRRLRRSMNYRTRRQETFKMSIFHVTAYRIGFLGQIRK